MALSGGSLVQPDLTLLLDLDGVIREATLAAVFGEDALTGWVGRPWFETVGDLAGDNVRAIVADARDSGVSAFRQVTQRFPSGAEMAMEFTTVRLGGASGLIAIGRSLQAVGEMQSGLVAAQQASELDAWKLREVETRYRLLFDATQDAVLLLAPETLRVVETNPAALRALGVQAGWEFLPEVAAADLAAFRTTLVRVREQGRAPGIVIRLGPMRAPWLVRASLLATPAGPVLLLQLAPAAVARDAEARAMVGIDAESVDLLLRRMPDAFAVIDPAGIIRRANDAFLDLVQMASEAAVLGQGLGRWLGVPGADVAGLIAGVHKHRLVRQFPTRLRGEHDADIEVAVSAAGASDIRPRLIGVLIRDVARQNATMREPSGALGDVLTSIVGQIGQITLLQLVKETTEAVERHAINEALVLSSGNRTVAADLLGLSRQSLYVKLNRYAIHGGTAPAVAFGD